jgi:hypothetical protein
MDQDKLYLDKIMLEREVAEMRARNDYLEDLAIMASEFKVAPGFKVQERGKGRWCISNGFSDVLNADGEWEFEPMAANRDEEFIERTRYDRDGAIRRAKEKANGKSPPAPKPGTGGAV